MTALQLVRLLFDASQRGRVYAISEAGGRGTIAKDVTKMRATICTLDLCPSHEEETTIRLLLYSIFLDGFPEAWPAGPGIELGVGVEERVPADHALIDALFVTLPIFSCERSLGSFVYADVELLRRQAELELCLFFL
jgi:hypothetical protein